MTVASLGKRLSLVGKLCIPLAFFTFARLSHADSIDDYLKSEMQRLHIPALAVGIVKNGQVVRFEALGTSDLEAKRTADISDLFEIGSLTKQFTSMGVMILVEGTRVDLEDPVSKYLPDAPSAWAGINVRNLLYQNSGLPDYSFVPKFGLSDKFTRDQFMQPIGKLPLDFAPGDAWAYSNTNYALLEWIIEAVTKEPYPKFIEENVLHPLGMTHTSFSQGNVDVPGLAKGYLWRGGKNIPAPRGSASIKADSGLISTVGDLIKWDEALANFRLVKRSSYQAIWTRGKLNSGRVRPYGMGWFLSMPFATPYMGHGGNSSGYSAGFSRYPKTRLSVIVLANLYGVGGERMAKHIAELFDPAVAPPPFTPITDPDPARTALVKEAIEDLSFNYPDAKVLEPELYAPMKTDRAKTGGAGPWRQLMFIDEIVLGDIKQQGNDTALTYRMTSMGKSFIVIVLWSPNNKLAQANIYNSD